MQFCVSGLASCLRFVSVLLPFRCCIVSVARKRCVNFFLAATVHDSPGGKVRAIPRGVLARGDIASDPARSHQIPWFRVRLRKGAKRRDYARSRVHIISARVLHPG